MTDTLQQKLDWFAAAKPEPTLEDACTQIGCAFEEMGELADALNLTALAYRLKEYANDFKRKVGYALQATKYADQEALLDATRDIDVTVAGIDYMYGADSIGAAREVSRANYSKFEGGKPVTDANGKIKKGRDYRAPELRPFVGSRPWAFDTPRAKPEPKPAPVFEGIDSEGGACD